MCCMCACTHAYVHGCMHVYKHMCMCAKKAMYLLATEIEKVVGLIDYENLKRCS